MIICIKVAHFKRDLHPLQNFRDLRMQQKQGDSILFDKKDAAILKINDKLLKRKTKKMFKIPRVFLRRK